MNLPVRPKIECERQHPTLAVRNLQASTAFYIEKLGFELGFEWGEPPELAGLNLGDVQLFLRQGNPAAEGCAVSFVVGDADELFEFHASNGVQILEPIEDRPYGLRDYAICDPDGYALTFGHYIYSVGDTVEVERVDLTIRLEKRLAALLNDLAEHKRMSLTGCLEEILLHTNEPFGDGVASPHTPRT